MIIHKNYNLQFINIKHGGVITKSCDLLDNKNVKGVDLSYYLKMIQFYENIDEIYLPEVENYLNGVPYEDISVEDVNISFVIQNVEIEWHGRVESIPILDFKKILEEYSEFLKTHPLNGTII